MFSEYSANICAVHLVLNSSPAISEVRSQNSPLMTSKRAEEAWRAELTSTSIGDLVEELLDTVAPEQLHKATAWISQVDITRRNR